MIDTQLIQAVAGIAGLMIGATYIVGGLIVSVYLSQYGVTEYQVLRVKYLVVGLTYLTNALALLVLAAIPAVFLIVVNFIAQQVLWVVSLAASIWMLWLWSKPPAAKRTFSRSGWAWFIASALASVFPLMVIFRQLIARPSDLYSALLIGQAVLALALMVLGQVYFYARYLYGRATSIFGSVDPIGMGVAVTVQLALAEDNTPHLKNIGVPIAQPGLTGKVLLLDETDTHYIIGIGREKDIRAIKVTKDIIKAISYLD